MKILSFILTFYILLLSLAPCDEIAAKAELHANETSQIQPLEQTQENGDDCSPFCICSCCHIFTVSNFPAFAVKDKDTVSTAHDSKIPYQNDYSQQHLANIWQPPKFNS